MEKNSIDRLTTPQTLLFLHSLDNCSFSVVENLTRRRNVAHLRFGRRGLRISGSFKPRGQSYEKTVGWTVHQLSYAISMRKIENLTEDNSHDPHLRASPKKFYPRTKPDTEDRSIKKKKKNRRRRNKKTRRNVIVADVAFTKDPSFRQTNDDKCRTGRFSPPDLLIIIRNGGLRCPHADPYGNPGCAQ